MEMENLLAICERALRDGLAVSHPRGRTGSLLIKERLEEKVINRKKDELREIFSQFDLCKLVCWINDERGVSIVEKVCEMDHNYKQIQETDFKKLLVR